MSQLGTALVRTCVGQMWVMSSAQAFSPLFDSPPSHYMPDRGGLDGVTTCAHVSLFGVCGAVLNIIGGVSLPLSFPSLVNCCIYRRKPGPVSHSYAYPFP